MTRLMLGFSGYTDSQVTTALSTPGRTIRFRYALLNQNLAILTDNLDGVLPGGTITYDHSAAIRRTGTLVFDDALTSNVDFLSNYIQPFMGVLMPDGGWADIPLGVFSMVAPVREYDGSFVTRQVQIFDLAQTISDDKLSTRYVAKKGTLYTDVIYDLLGNLSTVADIDPSTSVFPSDRTWPPGTSKLDIINKLLHGLGYQYLWIDALGQPQSHMFIAPVDDVPGWTYQTDANSLVGQRISSTINLYDVPNVFTRVITEGTRTLLSSTFTNSDPNSPTSTVNRGRSIVDWATANDCPDQAGLDALVRKVAAKASQIYEAIDFDTILMPFHGDRDIVTIAYTKMGISGDYAETGWSMTLAVGSLMSHQLSSVVSIDTQGE